MLARSRVSEAAYRQATASVFAHLAHGDTIGWRRKWLSRHRLEL